MLLIGLNTGKASNLQLLQSSILFTVDCHKISHEIDPVNMHDHSVMYSPRVGETQLCFQEYVVTDLIFKEVVII